MTANKTVKPGIKLAIDDRARGKSASWITSAPDSFFSIL
jgi:hypothetical protein